MPARESDRHSGVAPQLLGGYQVTENERMPQRTCELLSPPEPLPTTAGKDPSGRRFSFSHVPPFCKARTEPSCTARVATWAGIRFPVAARTTTSPPKKNTAAPCLKPPPNPPAMNYSWRSSSGLRAARELTPALFVARGHCKRRAYSQRENRPIKERLNGLEVGS